MLWFPLIPSGAGTMLLVSNDQLMPDQNAPDAKAGVFVQEDIQTYSNDNQR